MRIRKPLIPLEPFRNSERNFDEDVLTCLSLPAIQNILKDASKKFVHAAFQKVDLERSTSVANQVAMRFFENGDAQAALSIIQPEPCSDEQETVRRLEIPRTRAFHLICDAMVDALHHLYPTETKGQISQAIAEPIVAAVLDTSKIHDTSRPIDAIKGTPTICAYVPLPVQEKRRSEVRTAYWSDRGHSTTIKPTEEFLQFLQLVNVSTEEWKAAVESIHDLALDGELDDDAFDFEIERKQAWEAVRLDADEDRPSLIEVEELVYAVDNCPFGFTPLIAFSMPVEDVLAHDWSSPIKLTGGIIGLHDFINGSGDPKRFEGEIELMPAISNMLIAGAGDNDIASVHGFVNQNFRSVIEDATPTCRLRC